MINSKYYGVNTDMGKENLTLKEIKSQDPFEEFLFHAADYIYRRKKPFIMGAIGVLLILVAIFSGFFWKKHIDTARSEAFYEIEKMIDAENNGDQAKAIASLETFFQQYASTKQSVLAKFYLAQLHAKGNQLEKASQELEEVIDLFEKSSPLRILATIYLANVYRDMKKPEKAITLLEGADINFMEDTRLFELAEIYQTLGDSKKSKELLNNLTRDFPNSGYRQKVSELLAKIQ